MGGVGKVKSGKRMPCRIHTTAAETEFVGVRLAAIGGCISHAVQLRHGARCNKWPAAEESRLRQKRDAEPFLCGGGPDTFCVERNNNASSNGDFARSGSLSLLVCILFTRRERELGMPTHRTYLTRVQSVHGLIESQAHYFLLPLTPSLPPRRPDPLRPLPSTDRLAASDSP